MLLDYILWSEPILIQLTPHPEVGPNTVIINIQRPHGASASSKQPHYTTREFELLYKLV